MQLRISCFIVQGKFQQFGPFKTADEAVDWMNSDGKMIAGPFTISVVYSMEDANV
jgi:uncharacterized membrane protein